MGGEQGACARGCRGCHGWQKCRKSDRTKLSHKKKRRYRVEEGGIGEEMSFARMQVVRVGRKERETFGLRPSVRVSLVVQIQIAVSTTK